MLEKWQKMLKELKEKQKEQVILQWHKDTLEKLKGELEKCKNF